MKHKLPCLLTLATAALLPLSGLSQERIALGGDGDVSLKLEIERAIAKGVKYLESKQDAETGSWSDPELAAISGLATSAILGDPALAEQTELPASADKAVEFLLSQVKEDGGIYHKGLTTYNTAIAMMALLQSGDEDHLPVIADARRYLVSKQQDFGNPNETDHPLDGGIGYGDGSEAANMSTTQFTLGALYHSRKALADTEFAVAADEDLDWDAAITFLSRCQNGKAAVDVFDGKITVRDEDAGGFVYYPGNTKSDVIEIETDGEKRTALRSYGSISYAGLLSFIYADMDPEDPRLQAVLKWLQSNYTLEENPGMEAEGLYYYYHTLAKALAIAGIQKLEEPDGNKINWKQELALEVMSRQQEDGSWYNVDSNRWMEGDRILVTAYSMLALQHVYHQL